MVTKEEIAKENYELKAQNQTWSNQDATRRKYFAKVLNRTERDIYSPSTRTTVSDLSWEEIFCEVGKLMAFRDFRAWRDDIEMRMDVLARERSDASNLSDRAKNIADH